MHIHFGASFHRVNWQCRYATLFYGFKANFDPRCSEKGPWCLKLRVVVNSSSSSCFRRCHDGTLLKKRHSNGHLKFCNLTKSVQIFLFYLDQEENKKLVLGLKLWFPEAVNAFKNIIYYKLRIGFITSFFYEIILIVI